MKRSKWSGRALAAALLASFVAAGCDFITPVEGNPNAVPDASLDQLLVATSVGTYFAEEAQASRLASIWTQQMAGTDRQFTGFDELIITEVDADEVYNNVYTGGGLIDIRRGISGAEDLGRGVYAGVFKVHEALIIGMAASHFGDIEYSQAIDPEFPTPVLDEQRDVYTAVLALLDQAIADLQSGAGAPPGAPDFAYGGDASRWIAAANTLKARYNLHWVEVDGSSRYTAALTAAQQGILDASGDWMADHSTVATESNIWSQFLFERSGYISAGDYLVEDMKARSDPRLTIYYGEGSGDYAGQIVGSPPGNPSGDPGTDASSLAVPGYGAPGFDFPIVTCAENNFIIAEAEFQANGDEAAARVALDAALACEGVRKGVDLSAAQAANDGLIGAALFDEIMSQKYTSLFLNREVWNDYKRTCRPAIVTFQGRDVPGRLFYSPDARETNPNIPAPSQQPARNDNDPNAC
jgi:hypothetical protein